MTGAKITRENAEQLDDNEYVEHIGHHFPEFRLVNTTGSQARNEPNEICNYVIKPKNKNYQHNQNKSNHHKINGPVIKTLNPVVECLQFFQFLFLVNMVSKRRLHACLTHGTHVVRCIRAASR